MKKHLIIFLILFFVLPLSSVGQINYDKIRSKKFYSTSIDTLTEKTIIVEKRYAIVCFKQEDIKEQIKNDDNSLLKSLLAEGNDKIRLTDWWFDYYDEDRKRIFGDINYTNQDRKYINELIYVGADLITYGKTMIINKNTRTEVDKKMYIKRVDAMYGTRYVEFRLPDGKDFWQLLICLGE